MTTIRELLDGGWADMDTEIVVRRSDEADYANEVIPERRRADAPGDDNLLVLSIGDGYVMIADEGDDEDEDDEGCPGHESTSGPIGNVVYCDGTCR